MSHVLLHPRGLRVVRSSVLIVAGFLGVRPGMGQTTVGATSAPQAATVTITTAGTLGAVNVLTQGAANKDYKIVSGGTCAAGNAYAVNAACTVLFTFSPTRPGPRPGAVSLTNNAGTGVLGTAFLNSTGTGPLATFPGSTALTTVGSGFNTPYGVAVDGSGNLFIADAFSNVVKEIVAVNGVVNAGSTIHTVGSGFNTPYGVAVDGSGDVFVADLGNDAVKEIVAVNGVVSAGSMVTTVGSGFINPFAVAVDGSGNVFVGDYSDNVVKEIVAVNGVVNAGSAVSSAGSGFGAPFGLAVDGDGNVFVGDGENNAVKEIVAVSGAVNAGSTVVTVGSGFNLPFGVAVDGSGNVFVGDYGHSAVKEIVAVDGVVSSGSTVNTVGSGFSNPFAVAVDGGGHMLVADTGNNAMKEVDLTVAPAQAFAGTAVGSTSSDSPRGILVQNAGNASLNFRTLMTGTANFPISGSETCNTSTALAQSGVCMAASNFIPQTSGALSDTFTLVDNSLNVAGSTQTASLSGTGSFAQPGITAIAPRNGSSAGGTNVTITGANLTGATSVNFGATSAASFTVVSNTSITAVSPAGTGTVDIGVICPGGSSPASAADQFKYQTYGSLQVSAFPASIASGVAQSVTVSALDTGSAIYTPYTGTVTFSSSDASASLPGSYTFTAGDAGTHTFQVTLNTGGTQSLTVTDGIKSATQSVTVIAGYVWLTDGAGALSKLYGNGGAISSAAGYTGGGTPTTGLAFDSSSNAWSLNKSANLLVELDKTGTARSGSGFTGGGLNLPSQVAVDGMGRVWISNNNGSVSVFSNVGVAVSSSSGYSIGSGSAALRGIAVDISGNVWVASSSTNTLIEVLGGGAPVAPLAAAIVNNTTGVRP